MSFLGDGAGALLYATIALSGILQQSLLQGQCPKVRVGRLGGPETVVATVFDCTVQDVSESNASNQCLIGTNMNQSLKLWV